MTSIYLIAPLAPFAPQPAAMNFVQDSEERTTNVAQGTFSETASLLREIGLRGEISRILQQSNESQSKLVQEIIDVQRNLFNARLGEAQKKAENQKLKEENEALKKALGELNKAKNDLSVSLLGAQKEIETLTVKNQEIKKENEELKDSLEKCSKMLRCPKGNQT